MIRPNIQDVIPEKSHVIDSIKALYDWNILVDILDGEEYISYAKVKQYERHQKNLKILHVLVKKYLSRDEYRIFFDDSSKKANYAAYIGSIKTGRKKTDVKRCSEEDFYGSQTSSMRTASNREFESSVIPYGSQT